VFSTVFTTSSGQVTAAAKPPAQAAKSEVNNTISTPSNKNPTSSHQMRFWIVLPSWIHDLLSKFIDSKMNSLKRHVQKQLREVRPIECTPSFTAVHARSALDAAIKWTATHLHALFDD
jgi:hypothetical protein